MPIKRLLAFRDSTQEINRIKRIDDNYTFYNNEDIYSLVSDYTFTQDRNLFVLRNYVPQIADKISGLLYSFAPSHKITPTSIEDLYLKTINSNDNFFFNLEKAITLGGTTVVKCLPVFNNEGGYDGGIDLIAYPSYQVSILLSDTAPRYVTAVGIFLTIEEYGAQGTVSQLAEVWTQDKVSYYKRDKQLNSLSGWKETESYVNSFGIIPFIVHNLEQPVGVYSNTPISQVVNLNKILIQKYTDLNFIHAFNCFSMPVFENMRQEDIETDYDPRKAYMMPEGAKAYMLNKDGKILENLEMIKSLEREIYECSSVPRAAITGESKTGYASGKALITMLSPLKSLYDKRVRRQKVFEKKLCELIVNIDHITKYNNLSEPPQIESFKVNFKEDNVYPYGIDTALDIVQLIQTGAYDIVEDVIMKKDPDLTREEAEQKFKENLERVKMLNEAASVGDIKTDTDLEGALEDES